MAATFSKPIKINRWADTGTIVEPSEAKKDSGWVAPELPPDTFFNWWQNLTGEWTKWLDERLDDGATANEFVIRNPDDGVEVLNIKTISTTQGVQFFGDPNVIMRKDTLNRIRWEWDVGDSMTYDQTNDQWNLQIGAGLRLQYDNDGLRIFDGLTVGTVTVTPDTVRVIQLGNRANPAQDGDFWIGWFSTDEPVIQFSQSSGTKIDGFGGLIRFFSNAGSGTVLSGDNWSFPGTIEMDGGLVVAQSSGLVTPDADKLKIFDDNYYFDISGSDIRYRWNTDAFARFERLTTNIRSHWQFASGGEWVWDADDFRTDLDDRGNIGSVTGFALRAVFAHRIVPRRSAALPDSFGKSPYEVNTRTAIMQMGSFDGSTGQPKSNVEWNVGTATRLSAGQYRIEGDVNHLLQNVNACIHVTVNEPMDPEPSPMIYTATAYVLINSVYVDIIRYDTSGPNDWQHEDADFSVTVRDDGTTPLLP